MASRPHHDASSSHTRTHHGNNVEMVITQFPWRPFLLIGDEDSAAKQVRTPHVRTSDTCASWRLARAFDGAGARSPACWFPSPKRRASIICARFDVRTRLVSRALVVALFGVIGAGIGGRSKLTTRHRFMQH
jgi:hypothetical protein